MKSYKETKFTDKQTHTHTYIYIFMCVCVYILMDIFMCVGMYCKCIHIYY